MDGSDAARAVPDLAAEGIETTALAVIEPQTLPALPEGHAGYFAPAGKFTVDLDSKHAMVEIKRDKLSDRAKTLFPDLNETYVLVVIVGEDGSEYRAMRPYDEGFIPIRVPRPGQYHALGLVMNQKQAAFANRYLFKRSADDSSCYEYSLVDMSGAEPKLMGYEPLSWAVQTGVEKMLVTEEHVRILADTWYNRWIQSSVFYNEPPDTDAAYAARIAFGFTLQPFLWFAWMFGKGALVAFNGVRHAWFFGSRDYDWGALFDPDMDRSERAGWKCKRYSKADSTPFGEPEVQKEFKRALVPAQWWKGLLLGVLVASIFFAGTNLQMLIWSAVSIVGLAWLQFRIADNDGQYTPAWRYILNNGGGLVRSLRISRIPYVGKYHMQINRWLSAQRAKIFRPVIAPKTIGESK